MMRRKNIPFLLLLLSGLALSPALIASSSGHHDHEHHQTKTREHQAQVAHVHGEAELSIALENSHLDIILLSPAINIVGFEKPSGSAEQKAAIQRAEQQMAEPDRLFTFSGGDCVLESAASDISELLPNRRHGRTKEMMESHYDVEMYFRYRCAAPQTIKEIEVNLFDSFSGVEKVFAQWVNNHGQGAQSLSKDSRRLKLK